MHHASRDAKFQAVKNTLLDMARDGQDRTVIWDEDQLGYAGKKLIDCLAELGVLILTPSGSSMILSLSPMGRIVRTFIK